MSCGARVLLQGGAIAYYSYCSVRRSPAFPLQAGGWQSPRTRSLLRDPTRPALRATSALRERCSGERADFVKCDSPAYEGVAGGVLSSAGLMCRKDVRKDRRRADASRAISEGACSGNGNTELTLISHST